MKKNDNATTRLDKKSFNELRESEELFRNLAESTPMAILIYQDNKWMYANPSAERITGYTRQELAAMNFWDMVHPDFKQLVTERGKKRQAGENVISSYEFKIITKSGDEKWVLLNGTTSTLGGRPAGLINVIDITEMKRIEEELMATNEEFEATNEELINSQKELEESERRYRDIFDNFPVGIFQTTLEGNFITINNEMARILGYASPRDSAAPGENITNFYLEPEIRHLLLADVQINGHVDHFETQFRKKSGELTWVSINTHLRNRAGDGPYLEGYIQEITAQKKAEEEMRDLGKQLIQAQKMEAIGRLAGGIAHDFNNLLTAIMGNAEIALKTIGEGSGIDENINDILVTAIRAAELTKQLLAFSRRQVIQPVPIDINVFLSRVERMLRRIIGETITLHIRRRSDNAFVKADPTLMEQVIINLVVNARDAMPGGGTITIVLSHEIVTGVYGSVPAGDYIRIDVIDTGIGIDRDLLEKIFDPFFTTKGEKGTGLGLSTVYGIMRQNEGYITVRSEKGEGSTFTIFLPRDLAGAAQEKHETAGQAPEHDGEAGETILVVEDEDHVRKLIVRALASRGYTVLEAANSSEAINVSAREGRPIDLILTDIVLPDIPGPRLVEKVRSDRPGIRVLFMSGYTEHKIAANEAPGDGMHFIPKPFLLSELQKKIREVLGAMVTSIIFRTFKVLDHPT